MTEPERRASWLERFFDLCFVVAVGAVAHTLHDEPTTEGIALFAALFIPVWWSWTEYAWYATSFPEGVAFNRFAAFAAMLTVLAMATQVGTASHGDPRGVILAFIVFHAIVVALFLRAARPYPVRHAFSPLCSGIRAGRGDLARVAGASGGDPAMGVNRRAGD